ncbi:hypothetical protein FHR29_002261 [Sphingobacterium sp. JUb56]|nr:hypothetical protein [Sphingobacterium sp. JUb56]
MDVKMYQVMAMHNKVPSKNSLQILSFKMIRHSQFDYNNSRFGHKRQLRDEEL